MQASAASSKAHFAQYNDADKSVKGPHTTSNISCFIQDSGPFEIARTQAPENQITRSYTGRGGKDLARRSVQARAAAATHNGMDTFTSAVVDGHLEVKQEQFMDN